MKLGMPPATAIRAEEDTPPTLAVAERNGPVVISADCTPDLRYGDCLDVLRTLPDESISSIVTDPPYGLAEHGAANVAKALAAWVSGDREHVPDGRGFMGRDWDAFVPPPAVWDECLRVLKPGGHLLCFSGSRTVDLMGISVRLAGFEVFDSISWVYGSGFPKSHNVSKAIDKRPGVRNHAEFAAHLAERRKASGLSRADVSERVVGTRTGACWNWEHHQFPEAKWWPALRDLLGLDAKWEVVIAEAERERLGTRAGNLLAVAPGQGADRSATQLDVTAPATDDARTWDGWGTALKPAQEPILVARKPVVGTIAANVLAHGTGAMNVDACRVGGDERTNNAGGSSSLQRVSRVEQGYRDHVTTSVGEASTVTGRWPSNVVLSHSPDCTETCAEGCPVPVMDKYALHTQAPATRKGSRGWSELFGNRVPGENYADPEGAGASRFFPAFRYQAKAAAWERPTIGGRGWPTVKPLALMEWLVPLVTPPDGVVMDPFTGTGPTLEAAMNYGFHSLGIERDPFAYRLACQRLQLPDPADSEGAAND